MTRPLAPPSTAPLPTVKREERDVSARPGDGALSRVDAVKDERIRRWDVATPSATLIGRAERPGEDVSENVRRLHDEQHPAMQGHSARMHRLEKARITHAFCNSLSLTPWERDRALGIITELDLTTFGSQRAIQKVALVVVQYVVDDERKRRLGLNDDEWVRDQSPETLETLSEQFESLKDDPQYRDLLEDYGLDTTSVNRLNRTLREQLDEQDLRGAVLGRSPHRDPSMPAIRDRRSAEEKPVDTPDS
jgi:hypothetical protein